MVMVLNLSYFTAVHVQIVHLRRKPTKGEKKWISQQGTRKKNENAAAIYASSGVVVRGLKTKNAAPRRRTFHRSTSFGPRQRHWRGEARLACSRCCCYCRRPPSRLKHSWHGPGEAAALPQAPTPPWGRRRRLRPRSRPPLTRRRQSESRKRREPLMRLRCHCTDVFQSTFTSAQFSNVMHIIQNLSVLIHHKCYNKKLDTPQQWFIFSIWVFGYFDEYFKIDDVSRWLSVFNQFGSKIICCMQITLTEVCIRDCILYVKNALQV